MGKKLPVVGSDEIAKVAEKLGFEKGKTKGSHTSYRDPTGKRLPVTIQRTKEFPRGTLKGLMAQLGIESNEELRKLLEDC